MVVVAREPQIVAGLPAALRTAHRLAREEGVGRVLLCGASEDFRRTWGVDLDRLRLRLVAPEELGREVQPDSPGLVLASGGMPMGEGLRRFREQAVSRRSRAAWTWRGQAVALYEPSAGRVAERVGSALAGSLDAAAEDASVFRVEAADGSWMPLDGAGQIALAEKRIFAGLSHGRDGYLGQFDRGISIALTCRLARTAVTPNQITAASIVVGLAGAALITLPDGAVCFVGALLAWFSSILDGCDGEIARLKLLFSDAGRRFDLFGDYVVNFATLAGVALHVGRTRPEVPLRPLALLLATGVALSALCAWWLFVRNPGRRPEGLLRTFQRLASRDFVYMILLLAAVGRLEWFLYAAAVGAHLFWIGLSLLVAVRGATGRSRKRPCL